MLQILADLQEKGIERMERDRENGEIESGSDRVRQTDRQGQGLRDIDSWYVCVLGRVFVWDVKYIAVMNM